MVTENSSLRTNAPPGSKKNKNKLRYAEGYVTTQ
ncbi:hypothetical protein, unlikely [Trypanosoma brucei brucei TREU927]|uniref:Uncharacterized protein n=1 Tax=Trypanosoma brucei brucei (strain 927/4 GUTat10.1) TaxID=185431 RepID=Q38F89_TRYB2|nr:hypothetical protein, unlikely [Trypanosoma brucei brucei TREU927]EAN76531.1 hypothetical protein, unlikely [Trypanosoma brucei brucei TREU927]